MLKTAPNARALAGCLCIGLWQAKAQFGQLARHVIVNHMQLTQSGRKGNGQAPLSSGRKALTEYLCALGTKALVRCLCCQRRNYTPKVFTLGWRMTSKNVSWVPQGIGSVERGSKEYNGH